VTPRSPSLLAVAAALITVYLVWGSTYLAIAVMIESLPPLLAAGVRFLVAGLIMVAVLELGSRLRGRGAPERPSGREWRSTAVVGVALLLGGNGLVVLSELHIPSGIAAVVVASLPIWMAAMESVITRRRPSRLAMAGLVAGLVGVAIMLMPAQGIDRLDPVGVLMALAASISWAAGSLYARRAPLPRSGLLATAMEMLSGGAALVLVALVLGEFSQADPARFTLASLAALAYLIVFGSIVAFSAYTWLLAHVPVSTVSTYAYVNPIVAVALGALLLSEPITLRTLLASAIIIGAVVAMVSGRDRGAEQPATAEGEPDVDRPPAAATAPRAGAPAGCGE
jgi:drug/metabolite transporter (DMT)-like permease